MINLFFLTESPTVIFRVFFLSTNILVTFPLHVREKEEEGVQPKSLLIQVFIDWAALRRHAYL